MPRHVWHGRRGGRPKHAHNGQMDTKHLMNVLKGLQAVQDGQEDAPTDAAALVANAPAGRHDGRSGRTTTLGPLGCRWRYTAAT